jgi:hypothetical protein
MASKVHLFQIFGKLFDDNGCQCRQSIVVDDQFGRHMPHGPNHYMAVATVIVLIGQNPDAVMKNIPGVWPGYSTLVFPSGYLDTTAGPRLAQTRFVMKSSILPISLDLNNTRLLCPGIQTLFDFTQGKPNEYSADQDSANKD